MDIQIEISEESLMSEFGTPDSSHLDNIIQGPQN